MNDSVELVGVALFSGAVGRVLVRSETAPKLKMIYFCMFIVRLDSDRAYLWANVPYGSAASAVSQRRQLFCFEFGTR